MDFADRLDAARQLAAALEGWRGSHPLVLAIPRGAVPMGRIVADRLGGELDVVLVRKLAAPGSPEFAVGAIDESGWTWLAPHANGVGADAAYLEREKQTQLALLRARRALYTPGRQPANPQERVAIVVDDGLATGATMVAALHAVRAGGPSHLVCAVPVASREALDAVHAYADEVVCLHAPSMFGAVGRFYRSFPQVEDQEVVRLLGARAAG